MIADLLGGAMPRRTLLQTFGAGLASLGLGTAHAAEAAPKPKVPGQDAPEKRPGFTASTERQETPELPPLRPEARVGFAVIGLGRLSLDEILPAFGESKFAALKAVVTGDEAKGRRVAAQHGLPASAVLGYDAIERLADMPEVKAAYVVTPNGLHRDQVIRLAAAGKDVLCEKPMATNSADAQAMTDACAKAGVKLMIAYRCQYEPHHRALIKLTRSGELGALKMIDAHNGQVQGEPQQWRHDAKLAGGGALPDVGIYCLNMARYITGEEPVEASGLTWSTPNDPRFREVEENCAFRLRFPSGVVAQLGTAYDAHEARRLRLYFQRGWAEMDPAFSYKGLRLLIGRRSDADPSQELREERIIGEKNQFALELDHMAECVLTDRRPRTPGEEGVADHKVMEAIYASAKEGGRPVALARVEGRDVTRGPALGEG